MYICTEQNDFLKHSLLWSAACLRQRTRKTKVSPVSRDPRDPSKQPMPHANKENEKPCKLCPCDKGEEIPPYLQTVRNVNQPWPPATPLTASGQSLMLQCTLHFSSLCVKVSKTPRQPVHWGKRFHPDSDPCKLRCLWFEHCYQCRIRCWDYPS